MTATRVLGWSLTLAVAVPLPLVSACSSSASATADAGPGADAGDPTALSCTPESGTRLRRVVRTAEDGSTEFLRFHDKMFDADCSYTAAADGALRCLPVVNNNPFAQGQVRYTDVGCTQPIAELTAAGIQPSPRYLVSAALTEDGCSQVSTYYNLGMQQPITAGATIYGIVNGGCSALTAGANDYYSITSELPVTSFIEGTVTATDSGRLSIQQVDASDGSRYCGTLDALHDSDLDTDCALHYGEDGAIRCLPQMLPQQQVFSDATCTQPLQIVLEDQTCPSPAHFTGVALGGDCSYRLRVQALGDLISDPLYLNAGACGPADTGAAKTYQVGPVVSVFSFAELTADNVPVGSRLERSDLVAGGLRLFRGQWLDTMLNTPCSFQAAADGSVRCLPAGTLQAPVAQLTSAFTDAACATAAINVGSVATGCGMGTPTYVVDPAGPNRIYQAGALQTVQLYLASGGVCAAAPADRAFYAVGAEVTPDMFVGATDATE